jgi:hypothetical protein
MNKKPLTKGKKKAKNLWQFLLLRSKSVKKNISLALAFALCAPFPAMADGGVGSSVTNVPTIRYDPKPLICPKVTNRISIYDCSSLPYVYPPFLSLEEYSRVCVKIQHKMYFAMHENDDNSLVLIPGGFKVFHNLRDCTKYLRKL